LLLEEVKQAALERGAFPESLTLQSKYVSERSVLRATALGNVNLDIGTINAKEIDDGEAEILACELFGINQGVRRIFDMKNYHVFACEINKKKLFLKAKRQPVLVLDKYGRVRLSVDNAAIYNGSPKEVANRLDSVLGLSSVSDSDDNCDNGNGKNRLKSGDLAPQVHILDGSKIVDFSSLTSPEHVSKAVRDELSKVTANKVTVIIKI
jgi:hypothetical protein